MKHLKILFIAYIFNALSLSVIFSLHTAIFGNWSWGKAIMKKTACFLFIIATLSSCKIVHSLSEINKKHAKVYTYKTADKEVKFVPMHHLGKQKFYDDVKRIVTASKNDGYKVYYELVSNDFKADSTERDAVRRKLRKLKGFNGTYKDAVKGTFLEKHVLQPSYKEMGTDDSDLRADVNSLELINEWERQNGKIVLDSMDMNTPFTEKYEKSSAYTQKQFQKVLVEYRNEVLVNMIRSSPDKKILVLYGAGHRKDFKKKLLNK